MEIYSQKNDLNTANVSFCDIIGCNIRVYNFILLRSSVKIFFIPMKNPYMKCPLPLIKYLQLLTWGLRTMSLTLLRMDGRGKFTPPCWIFFNNFFSLKLRAWNFLALHFYPLYTMWWNFIKKYWLVDKLWNFCHQWLAKSARYQVGLVN